MRSPPVFSLDVAVVGGCGRAGLPLGLSLADSGLRVVLYDIDAAAVELVQNGTMPFEERGAVEALARVLETGSLQASTDPTHVADAGVVIVVVGTPIDEYLNPDVQAVPDAIRELSAHLRDGQLLILRSTVFPGVTAMVEELVGRLGLDVDVAFCPERIAEGHAMRELRELPQIVSGRTPRAVERAHEFFHVLTPHTIELSPEEAELAKLFTNAWRYVKFAAANQFFMMASQLGLDFRRIRDALADDYPRAADMPRAGFAAGPCLLKDTMQLAAFNNNNFALGHVSMMINEGLPLFLVSQLERRFDLPQMTVGLLGMAFKGDSDDIRASLSYKLKRILKLKARAVRCTDPHVTVDDDLLSLEEVLDEADLLVIGAPHREYAGLTARAPVIDIWGVSGTGIGL